MKKRLFAWSIIVCFMLLIFTTKVDGYTFPMDDSAYDVAYLFDYVYQYQGAYKDEIDILDAELNGTNLEVRFLAKPKIDLFHLYHYRIHWDGDEDNYVNYSQASLGSSYGMKIIANYALTHIVNSTGYAFEFMLNDTVTVVDDKVIMPIVNHTLIQNISNPSWIKIYATNTYTYFSHWVYWCDFLPDDEAWWLPEPTPSPSITSSVPITGLSVIIIVPIIIAAKKKRRN
ncbi:MAG: hypothetical protein FK733_15385 [Asgard group archaeon]|nr:hypothetical protein [Asgard group archaeon]